MNILRFVVILAACAFVRVWLVAHSDTIARDGVKYVEMARQWPGSPKEVIRRYDYHVGYPALMAASHRVLGWLGVAGGDARWELAGQVISLGASLLAMAALWWFAAITFNARIAWITVLLFGVGRKWAALGADVLSDSLAVCLQLWAALLALRTLRALRAGQRRSLAWAAGAGLCAGAGYLVRPEALAAAVLAAGLWAIYAVRRQASRRLTGACVSAAVAATLACAIPYMIAIGGLTKKKAIDDFVSAPVPADPPLARVALVGHYLPPHKFADRLINAAHPVVGVAMCLFVGAWLVLRLVPAGRLTGPRKWLLRPEPAAAGLMAAATVLFASLLMAMYVNLQYMSHRHVMFVAALLAPLGAAGFVFLEGLIGGILRRCRVPAALVNRLLALSMVAAAVAMTFNTLHPPHGDGPAIRAAAAALAAQVRPGDRVLTDDPRVTYYAHLPGGPLPVKDLDAEQFDRLIAGADYIVVSHQNIGPPAGHVARRLSSPPRRQVCPPPGAKGPQADAVRVYRTGRRTPPN